MSPRKPARSRPQPLDIPTREAVIFGVTLLGQVSATLVGATVLGFLVDYFAGTQPIGLAVGVVIGGAAATLAVLTKVKAKLTE